MTEDELQKQIEDNIAAELAKEEERKRRLPIPFRVGPGGTLQSAFIEACKRLGLRGYAAYPITLAEGGALVQAAHGAKGNLVRAVETLANTDATVIAPGGRKTIISTGLRQEWRPAADAGQVPELPIDHITGLRCRNPFLPLPPLKPGETEPHFDHASQHVVRELSPRLARWLEDCARNGGSPSMAMLDALEAERLEAEHLRGLRYDSERWTVNKLRRESGASLTEMNNFVRGIEDPFLVLAHRKEAELGAPRLHFDNLTFCMKLADRNAEVRAIHRAAGEILRGWQEEAKQKAAA